MKTLCFVNKPDTEDKYRMILTYMRSLVKFIETENGLDSTGG